MRSHCSTVTLVGVAMLLWTAQSQDSCKGHDGHPGEPGSTGRDGWPGSKGEKGESAPIDPASLDAVYLLSLKGAKGKRGSPGALGPKGYHGDLGMQGYVGYSGPRGSKGGNINQESFMSAQSAFSVVRTLNTYPSYNAKVKFQTAILNRPGDFSLNSGIFTSRTPGIYYFVFHSSSKVSMCLRLVSSAPDISPLGFCDYNNRGTGQVLSGGGVLQLARGQQVWLEAFRESQLNSVTTDLQEKQIIFNGFLLFTTSQPA